MWSFGERAQHIGLDRPLRCDDQILAYPGRGKTNDAFSGVSPDCLSMMGRCTCACMC
jgi:hypothetical protein